MNSYYPSYFLVIEKRLAWWLKPVILATWKVEDHGSRPAQAKSLKDHLNQWLG
jgi:hypothetical protein